LGNQNRGVSSLGGGGGGRDWVCLPFVNVERLLSWELPEQVEMLGRNFGIVRISRLGCWVFFL